MRAGLIKVEVTEAGVRKLGEPWDGHQLDFPGGPRCQCGKPSTHESGWCGEEHPDDMCPNCVTPWKCNGPHVPEGCPVCGRTDGVTHEHDVEEYPPPIPDEECSATEHVKGCRHYKEPSGRPDKEEL